MATLTRHLVLIGSIGLNLALFAYLGFASIESGFPSDVCGPGTTLRWGALDDAEVMDVACVDESGRRHGVALRLVNGEPSTLALFSHDVLDGASVMISNGGVEVIERFSDGKPSHTSVILDPGGRPRQSFTIDNENNRASHRSWYPNGELRSLHSTSLDRRSGLPTGPLEGAFWVRSPEGTLLVQGRYEGGERVGLWKCRIEDHDDFTSVSIDQKGDEADIIECLNVVSDTHPIRSAPEETDRLASTG